MTVNLFTAVCSYPAAIDESDTFNWGGPFPLYPPPPAVYPDPPIPIPPTTPHPPTPHLFPLLFGYTPPHHLNQCYDCRQGERRRGRGRRRGRTKSTRSLHETKIKNVILPHFPVPLSSLLKNWFLMQ